MSPANTLHVYVNRMQVPVLLLDSYRHPTHPIPASRFTVNLAGTSPIRPSEVRLEGDDPIALALFLDRSDPEESLWDSLPKALPALLQTLRPQDRVEIYVIDGCHLRRVGPTAEADFTQVPAHIKEALAAKPYDDRSQDKCSSPVGFWDAMLYIAAQMNERSGRHIVLALSNGLTTGNPVTMERLRRVLNLYSTSVFNVRHGEPGMNDRMLQVDNGRIFNASSGSTGTAFAPLDVIWSGYLLGIEAELSGGMVISSTTHGLPQTLADVMQRVRGRYIVEFPRPEGLTGGTHSISISVGKGRYFIRPAGVSVPVTSDAERHANTITPDSQNTVPPVFSIPPPPR